MVIMTTKNNIIIVYLYWRSHENPRLFTKELTITNQKNNEQWYQLILYYCQYNNVLLGDWN